MKATWYESLSHPYVDFGIQRDAEESFSLLVSRLQTDEELSDIPGLVFRKDGEIQSNQIKPPEDLDRLPFPEFPQILLGRYHSFIDHNPPISLIFSRGCPYACTYCSSSSTAVRYRSIENVLDEMGWRQKQGGRLINFCDEAVNARRGALKELCEGILKRGIKINFTIRARPDYMDKEDVRVLAEAGCTRASFGIDITPNAMSKKYNRFLDLEKSRQTIRWCGDIGLFCSSNFILGLEEDSTEDSLERIRESQRVSSDLTQFLLLSYFPGTKIYSEFVAKTGNSFFKDHSLNPQPGGYIPLCDSIVSPSRRLRLLKKAYWTSYFYPKAVLRRVRRVKGQVSIFRAAEAFLSILWFCIRPIRRKDLQRAVLHSCLRDVTRSAGLNMRKK